MVKNLPAVQEGRFNPWVGKIRWPTMVLAWEAFWKVTLIHPG